MVAVDAPSVLELKDKGNKCFADKDYDKALSFYSRLIIKIVHIDV